MTLHDLRGRIRRGPVIATSVLIPSPVVVEALGHSAFDAICIDTEHTPLTVTGVEELLRAADVHGMPAVVRVPEVGTDIARVLDSGASGIVVPRIESAAEAADVVRRARYTPLGARGVGPGRGTGYGATLADYVAAANETILVSIQIETKVGADDAERILATPGLDAVVIGPTDLAMSLGVEPGSAEQWAAIERIYAVAEANGVAKGAFSFTTADTERHLDLGATLLFVESDLGWLTAGAARARAALTPRPASAAMAEATR